MSVSEDHGATASSTTGNVTTRNVTATNVTAANGSGTVGRATYGVVGGGIIGLAVARELALRHPGAEVVVVEKEPRLAAHQTGHNSGVIHAGLYYQPGSLKATLCLRGGALLREFSQQHGIAFQELGKLVVATNDAELEQLAVIEDRARRNQVPDLVRLDRAGMTEIEPHITGIAALHSPHTAVIDYRAVCEALAADLAARGGRVLLSSPVTAIRDEGDRVAVTAGGQTLRVDRLVACGGLSSDALAAMVGDPGDVRIIPFRGEYYHLREGLRDRVRGLVYPVPDPRYPFLGVHLTRDLTGGVHVGPNAVLALALEGYRWRDVNPRDLARVLTWPGMRRLAREHWRNGLAEMAGSLSRRRFATAVRRYLPEVQAGDLTRAPAGVRAQAVRRSGELVDDFVIRTSGRVTVVRNAPSPAATSSLAIAEHIVGQLVGAEGRP
ncbi:L-2-hydroxyglutarate oxidase [Frankia sp. AiPs1]|uniref:L-2-hydroxyglutarate oxidase n=1 Tax=Frankia sp. AiPs1 TaxID=573493 RepID=UPI00204409E4|nr:L-2-hydroxyglutarate oxidase [Frankia sp. AiPs1]MCM3925495.1 L-2-hydroxyglutarate oxidase [Frankia sp. AiPs1]